MEPNSPLEALLNKKFMAGRLDFRPKTYMKIHAESKRGTTEKAHTLSAMVITLRVPTMYWNALLQDVHFSIFFTINSAPLLNVREKRLFLIYYLMNDSRFIFLSSSNGGLRALIGFVQICTYSLN